MSKITAILGEEPIKQLDLSDGYGYTLTAMLLWASGAGCRASDTLVLVTPEKRLIGLVMNFRFPRHSDGKTLQLIADGVGDPISLGDLIAVGAHSGDCILRIPGGRKITGLRKEPNGLELTVGEV